MQGGKTMAWQRHHDQVKLKLDLTLLHSVCETSFSPGSKEHSHENYWGRKVNKTDHFLSLFFLHCYFSSVINLSSSPLPSPLFGGGGGWTFFLFFSLLSGLLLLSSTWSSYFSPNFYTLSLLVEKTLSLLGSFFLFYGYILNSFWHCAKALVIKKFLYKTVDYVNVT